MQRNQRGEFHFGILAVGATEILKTQPDVQEICVENVKRLRFAAESGQYDTVFKGLNDAMAAGLH